MESYVAQRVIVPPASTDGTPASTAPTDASSSSVWYPLPSLTRWCGVVNEGATVAQLKQAMVQARAVIEASCKANKMQMDKVYAKKGNVVCVNEVGFRLCIQGWSTLHPSNDRLHQFNQRLPNILQRVFHQSNTDETGVKPEQEERKQAFTASARRLSVSKLMRKYAPLSMDKRGHRRETDDESDDIGNEEYLTSASLAAPEGQFSLAAFLDQHLQMDEEEETDMAASDHSKPQPDVTVSIDSMDEELAVLERSLESKLLECARTHPPLISHELERLAHFEHELSQAMRSHTEVSIQLDHHIQQTEPMVEQIDKLQSNMLFIQRVQTYERAMRRAMELSERCREAMTGHQEGQGGSDQQPHA